ncbi:fungal-specific transcription factor domain-containing protein [Aspergillus alliaceus]|uniref:Fungal-specific transcription factor domain-containing protein n=2 Tax=Petromyces alliaceus TaxID=209559 RepID=A0A5N7C4B6_PETAA|nr:fungal-specific transcription factor domain-containing protein [Aspergillus alliaceus]
MVRMQEREISLLMHYLDDVFPLQFPFPETAHLGKREWLLTILSSTKAVYYATLSLSLLHKEACLDTSEIEEGLIWREEKTRYYILALRESQQLLQGLRSNTGKDSLKGHINALANTVQLISFESSCLSKGDWQIHLRAGTSLIPALIESWKMIVRSHKPTSSVWSRLDASDFCTIANGDHLSFECIGSLRFFTNMLAAFGVLSCVSLGPMAPFMDYRYLMDNHAGLIQMDQIIGCKNWVMSTILDVGILDQWKREELSHFRLSMKELTRRATSIEMVLESGIKEARSGGVVDIVTSIYATSALTYLHSVVSGLNPYLSEVQDSVSRTITLLKQLPDSRVVSSLVWPLCITGCMASPDHEAFFTGIIHASGLTQPALRNGWYVLEIMENAWKIRDLMTQPSAITWEDMINGHNPPTLLI